MKKLLSVILAFSLVFTMSAACFAGGLKADAKLKFKSGEKFKIMVLADVQDEYPMKDAVVEFISEALDYAKPDLVVFCGDNIVTSDVNAYSQLLTPLVSRNVPFTFVFGNHDDECSDLNKEQMLAEYQKYAGCLAYDDNPALHGCATHNLPILSSDGSKVAFNLWLMDSGDYAYDADGTKLGYDWVRADQVSWYQTRRDALKAENGGELVPSLMFQHIIPEEPCKKLFYEAPFPMGDLTINFQDGTQTTFIPSINNYEGYIFEKSCPGVGNDGQWQAIVDGGDVLGVVIGHDHVNNFVADIDGVDIIQTPGVTYNSYYNDLLQGTRIIEIDENDAWNYSTYNLTTNQLALEDGSRLSDAGDRNGASYILSFYFLQLLDKLMELLRYAMLDVPFANG